MSQIGTPGYKTARLLKIIKLVVQGVVNDFYRSSYYKSQKELSLEALIEGGIDIQDSNDFEESIVNQTATTNIFKVLIEKFPRETSPEQWCLLQSILEVIRLGADPLNTSQFYNAIFEWIQKNYPQSGIKRKSIRIYWLNLCRTLERIMVQEGAMV